MGVASAIPYDISADRNHFPEYCYWKLHDAYKVENDCATEERSLVSVFAFKKSSNPQDVCHLELAQRGSQRLKSLKHPYVLSFFDSLETDESLHVITEHAVPIGLWLTSADGFSDLEVTWGIKCLFEALHFLHSKCRITHCNINLQSCFYTKNGDWKLGSFDLACCVSSDHEFLEKNLASQDKTFAAPEVVDGSWKEAYGKSISSDKKNGNAMDIFAMGKLLEHINSSGNSFRIPECLGNTVKRMLSTDYRRRPTCSSILKAPCFHTEEINLMTAICELPLKPNSECVDVFIMLQEKADLISKAVCSFKILPVMSEMLGRSISDFQERDKRENCRRIVGISLDLLVRFGEQNKVDNAIFESRCLRHIEKLWMFSDRAIRTSLLRSLKSILYLLPREVVNKKIFDPLLSGFSDSNSKMREDTLKSLVDVVDKLDENQLQDKLVRCICNLQNDSEASVRTNAVIFLSRISRKLSRHVRNRVLTTSFCKAMKDPFVHCRIAGLRAVEATIESFEHIQICSRIIPQVSLLLLDKSRDVRQLALCCLNSCTQVVKDHFESVDRSDFSGGGASPSSGDPRKLIEEENGWTSWALKNFSQSVEKVITDGSAEKLPIELKSTPEKAISDATLNTNDALSIVDKGWEDDLSLDELLENDATGRGDESACDLQDDKKNKKKEKFRREKKSISIKKLNIDEDEFEAWDDF